MKAIDLRQRCQSRSRERMVEGGGYRGGNKAMEGGLSGWIVRE